MRRCIHISTKTNSTESTVDVGIIGSDGVVSGGVDENGGDSAVLLLRLALVPCIDLENTINTKRKWNGRFINSNVLCQQKVTNSQTLWNSMVLKE